MPETDGDVAMSALEQSPQNPPLCDGCHVNPATEPHSCPYASGVNNNDDDEYCTCCEECEAECADCI